MTVTTKFDSGDVIYYLNGDTIITDIVLGVRTLTLKEQLSPILEKSTRIDYFLEISKDREFKENELFSSKSELLKKIFNGED